MSSAVYFPLTWLLIAGGLLPIGWVLSTYRPARWQRGAQVDAMSLIIVIVVFYGTVVGNLLLGARTPPPANAWLTTVGRIVADVLLWHRAFRWRAMRRAGRTGTRPPGSPASRLTARTAHTVAGMPTSPVVVGLIRGAIEAALIAALEVVAAAVLGVDLGPYAAAAPLVVYTIRQAESVIDQRIDPTKQRGPLGGAPHQDGGL